MLHPTWLVRAVGTACNRTNPPVGAGRGEGPEVSATENMVFLSYTLAQWCRDLSQGRPVSKPLGSCLGPGVGAGVDLGEPVN